ncbi:20384_t:CDS:2, partial [Gigaspora margarita]
ASKFQEFVYSINYWYHIPAKKQLSNNILDNIYKNVEHQFSNFFANQTELLLRQMDGQIFGKSSYLEEALIQICIEKVNSVIMDGAVNYV